MKFRKITKKDLQELNQNKLMRLEEVVKLKNELTEFEKEKYLNVLDYVLTHALSNGAFYDSEDYLVLNLEMSEYQSILEMINLKQTQLVLAHFISKNLIEYRIRSTEVSKDHTTVISNLYLLIPDILTNNGITYERPEEKMCFG